ncbi:MAG TPA: hypothetical protein VKT32_09015 [Chthonomonadaceae bacterium]|nr:hypothetical protein [Chthonomonadaceae bacterium]
MSRLEQISPEEMPKVVQIASQLYEQDRTKEAEAQERQAYVDAAKEVDLPPEYMERAAAELQTRRIAEVKQRRRVRNGVLATLGGVVALAGLWKVTHRPPEPPTVYHFAAQQWRLDVNPETKANVTFQSVDGRENVAVLHVDQFTPRASDGQYFVNLDTTQTPRSLASYRTASFFVRGDGLNTVRLYLEAGPTERWRSPAIPATDAWQQQTVDLKQFDHQVRPSASAPWQRADASQQPDRVEKLSFKVGSYMNDASAHGDIALDDLEFR